MPQTVELPLRVIHFEGDLAVPPNMTKEEFIRILYRLGVHIQGIIIDRGVKVLEVDDPNG